MEKKTTRKILAELLDGLSRTYKNRGHGFEKAFDRVVDTMETLPRENIFSELDKAIGKNEKRKKMSFFLLSTLIDMEGIDERIHEGLKNSDEDIRADIIQTIGLGGLEQFAPYLNDFILNDPSWFCRGCALDAASRLKLPVNLPAVLQAAKSSTIPGGRVLWALKEYAAEECREYLQIAYTSTQSNNSNRVIAAWGLGKLGDKDAIKYLREMLFDPDIDTENQHIPGESVRAGQALCNIYGWEFEWGKDFFNANIDQWVKKLDRILGTDNIDNKK